MPFGDSWQRTFGMENYVYTTDSKSLVETIVNVGGTIFSGILMFLTFLYQRRTFKEVQFKSAFYQTQNFHRKLADALIVKASVIAEDIEVVYKTFLGRQCFLFAKNEVQCIIVALSQKRYLGELEDKDKESVEQWNMRQGAYSEDERKKATRMEQLAILAYRYKFYIKTYHISEGDYNKVNKLVDKKEYAFQLFLRKRGVCFEHYTRSLHEILEYICAHPQKLNKEPFVKYVMSQMAIEELWFIKLYAQINELFRETYIKSGMNKIVATQLANNININTL